jgi:hypothetical protein
LEITGRPVIAIESTLPCTPVLLGQRVNVAFDRIVVEPPSVALPATAMPPYGRNWIAGGPALLVPPVFRVTAKVLLPVSTGETLSISSVDPEPVL